MEQATRHILLRDRRHWLGNSRGLALDRDGALSLMRVPGPEHGKPVEIAASYPSPRKVSGLALGPCERVFVSDTAGGRVLLVEPQCPSQVWLEGFDVPCGLAFCDDGLLVADSGQQRVQGLASPGLETHWSPVQGIAVTSIAIDSQRRLVYVDPAQNSVHRLSSLGVPDMAFDTTLAASGRLAAPLFVAIGDDDELLVSDSMHDRVDAFDDSGVFLFSLNGPPGWMPGAIAADAGRIYVANAADGRILLFDSLGVLHGKVNGWRGPVTALSLDANGDLYIKPGLDAQYLHFVTGSAFVTSGQLEAGPFDAGIEREWERAWLEADIPAGTAIAFELAQAALPAPPPAATDWKAMPGTDALLAPLAPTLAARRYVWMRLTLSTNDALQTPVLTQARAATEAEDLREHLPSTYRRHDPYDVLKRMTQLLRGEFLALEERIDGMPRVADPDFALASSLHWLSQWLALELPQIANDDERRVLIEQAVQLFARRGTPSSIADFAELHTGIRPAIIESFTQRRLWMLGASSRLGFDTQLPPLDPLGMVVPDSQIAEGCCPVNAGEPEIGRAVVGESGPLAAHQIGLPLYAEEAYRFCVVVDGYRVGNATLLNELCRIIDREKPAHTDYRVEVVAPELRIGLQAMIGIDAIVGGDPPAMQLDQGLLNQTAYLMPPDTAARVGESQLDGSMQLN